MRFEDKVKIIEGKQGSRKEKGGGATCLVWGALCVGGVGHALVLHLRDGIRRAWLVSCLSPSNNHCQSRHRANSMYDSPRSRVMTMCSEATLFRAAGPTAGRDPSSDRNQPPSGVELSGKYLCGNSTAAGGHRVARKYGSNDDAEGRADVCSSVPALHLCSRIPDTPIRGGSLMAG